MKKILWWWKSFWGRKYRIKISNNLGDDEMLIYKHRCYISNGLLKKIKEESK